MLLPIVLGLLALAIIAPAIVWAWHHDSLRTTEQDLLDIEFDRIVRRLDSTTR